MILLIDNYDSFTYNVYQYLCELKAEVKVVRNNEIDLAGIKQLSPASIVISPGPGAPDSAGICLEAIKQFSQTVPILGVCLGHQSIAQAFGAKIIKAPEMMHGKTSELTHTQHGVFAGLSSPLTVTRYHSLIVEEESLPDCFEVTARSVDRLIMGIRHKTLPIEGVQFHPESYMTSEGLAMFQNFLESSRGFEK